MEEEIKALREEIRLERTKTDALKVQLFEEYSNFEHRMDEELREQQEFYNTEVQRLDLELGQTLQVLKDTKDLLSKRDANAESLQRNADWFQARYKEALSEVEALRTDFGRDITQLRTNVSDMKKLLSDRERIAESLQLKYDLALKDLDWSRAETATVRSKLGIMLESVRKTHETEMQEHLEQFQQVKSLLATREVQAETLQRKFDQTTKELQQLHLQLDSTRSELGNQMNDLRKQLAESKKLLSLREENSELLQRQCDAANKGLDESRMETTDVRSFMGATIEQLRNKHEEEVENLREMLASRESAQEISQRMVDQSAMEVRQAREETANVRMEMGAALESLRNKAAQTQEELRSLLEARNNGGNMLQQQLDDSINEARKVRKEMDDLRTSHGMVLKDLRAKLEDSLALAAKPQIQKPEMVPPEPAPLIASHVSAIHPPKEKEAGGMSSTKAVLGVLLTIVPVMHWLECKSRL